jgi:predicted lipoprotein with Yx(FWY)xxD motif
MTQRRLSLLPAAAAVGALVLLAGCGSSGGNNSATASSTTTTTTARTSTTTTAAAPTATTASGPAPVYEVKTGEVSGLGTVLVNGLEFTLYVFAPDRQSGKSTCYGECAKAWPPLLLPSGVTQPTAGSGVKQSLLGTTERTDGTVQVTYNKWPLYGWVIDSAPGQATGQDINNLGGKWYVITPEGQIITKHP